MKNSEFDISIINHNLKNNICAAFSCLQLLMTDHPNISENKCFNNAVECLKNAMGQSNEIAFAHNNYAGTENNLIETNLSIIDVKDQLFEHTKVAYKKFRKMHAINISDIYKPISEEKYIAINNVTLNKLRENIITNAINANASKIDFLYEMKKYCLIITIQDNGKGMSQNELDKLMLSQLGDGILNGIGTKSILHTIKEHGFTITYTSVKDVGTTIRILCAYKSV